MMLLLLAPAVSAAEVDDVDTVVAAALPPTAEQQSVLSHCMAAERLSDGAIVAAATSWISFLQHLMNEAQSASDIPSAPHHISPK